MNWRKNENFFLEAIGEGTKSANKMGERGIPTKNTEITKNERRFDKLKGDMDELMQKFNLNVVTLEKVKKMMRYKYPEHLQKSA